MYFNISLEKNMQYIDGVSSKNMNSPLFEYVYSFILKPWNIN